MRSLRQAARLTAAPTSTAMPGVGIGKLVGAKRSAGERDAISGSPRDPEAMEYGAMTVELVPQGA